MRLLLYLALIITSSSLGVSNHSTDVLSVEELRTQTIIYPDSADLHVRLALRYLEKGTVRGRALAIKHLREAVELCPDNFNYHMLLAEVYLDATYWRYGVNQLIKAIRIRRDTRAYSLLGKAYMEKALEGWQDNWFKRALRVLSKAVEADSLNIEATKSLALCYFDIGKADSCLLYTSPSPRD